MNISRIALALAVLLAAVPFAEAALAAGAKPRPKPEARPSAPAVRPAGPDQDQSYLFLSGPKQGRGVPDYITAGTKHSNQPWFMTRYDRLGNWP